MALIVSYTWQQFLPGDPAHLGVTMGRGKVPRSFLWGLVGWGPGD